ncbi:hypothetical protein PENTCL1PPCAC_29397 [Pristionchus entomophagus]|uniref:Uncharacterized protein n=1 Tax=Pristionchus entomophagus TaxID=358040 RepID=A0AAV5UM04_9BILA|nr:hypothetical protein PENTCL1PPCAC_29397 [Pristionchus entomophagus]
MFHVKTDSFFFLAETGVFASPLTKLCNHCMLVIGFSFVAALNLAAGAGLISFAFQTDAVGTVATFFARAKVAGAGAGVLSWICFGGCAIGCEPRFLLQLKDFSALEITP